MKVDKIHFLVNSGKAILLDVREEEEYKQFHFPKAILHPLSKIKLAESLPEELKETSKEIFIHCRAGRRSFIAYEFLKEKYPELNLTPLEYSLEELQS